MRMFLESIPDKNKKYEPGFRGLKRLLSDWTGILDRARTVGASTAAKPWMDENGVPRDPVRRELEKLSPEKQKEWKADYAAWGSS